MELSELQETLEEFQKEQLGVKRRKVELEEELRLLEIRFHRGAGAILALNRILNNHGEFPQLLAGEALIEEFSIPVEEPEPVKIDEDALKRKRDFVSTREAIDWVHLLDRRPDEDNGLGSEGGTGGRSNGAPEPERQEPERSKSNEREPAPGGLNRL